MVQTTVQLLQVNSRPFQTCRVKSVLSSTVYAISNFYWLEVVFEQVKNMNQVKQENIDVESMTNTMSDVQNNMNNIKREII